MTKKIVEEVNALTMDGDSDLEKGLNTLITIRYVGSKNLPSGECLSEAKHILGLFEKQDLLICHTCYKMYPISSLRPREEQVREFNEKHRKALAEEIDTYLTERFGGEEKGNLGKAIAEALMSQYS